MSAQADKKSGPSCSKSYRSSDIQTKERDAELSLSRAARGEEKTDGPAVAKAMAGLPAVGTLALLHLKAVAGGGKWALAKWVGHVEEDEAAGRYARAELAAFVAGRTAVTESPWRLAESVRRHADMARAAAFAARLRDIRGSGLTRAEGADGPARVVYVEPERPLLVIERRIPSPPGTSYGPQTKRWDVTTPAGLAAWTFRPEQPVFAFAAGPEPVEGRGRERSGR